MTIRIYVLAAVLLVALQGLMLLMFGQPAICACGYIKLWEGVVLGPGNSQHLTDWYTFSHVIHGLLFYGALKLLFPRMPLAARFLLAIGVEVSWEVVENTPWLIDHYRQQALAQGYTGDSIINSVSDAVTMMLGFLAAWRLPVWASVTLGAGLEGTSLWYIRDGLTLNVLNFLHQFQFIKDWQSGSRL